MKDRVLHGAHTQQSTFPILHSGFIVTAVTQTNKNTSKQLRNLFVRVRVHKWWLNECGRDRDYGRVDSSAFLRDKNSSGIRLPCCYGRRSFVKHSEWKNPAFPSDNNMGWEERETDSIQYVVSSNKYETSSGPVRLNHHPKAFLTALR